MKLQRTTRTGLSSHTARVLLAGLAGGLVSAPVWAQTFTPPQNQPNVTRPAPIRPPVDVRDGFAGMPADQVGDGPAYQVSGVELNWFTEAMGNLPTNLPDANAILASTVVRFGRTQTGWTRARPGMPTVDVRLSEIPVDAMVHKSGIRAISEALVAELNRRDIFGVFVGPSAEDINQQDQDLRGGRTTVKMFMVYGLVGEVRTVGAGERTTPENRVNNELHTRIRNGSPVGRDSLLLRNSVDDYIFRLNRHPGRRVDVAVAPSADSPGRVNLDYLVAESKPWSVYAQISNTGTKETNEWRERFGFVHNQLTDADDILRLDYITASFDDTHALVGSYERPLADRLKGKVTASWNQFTSADVGAVGADFEGSGFSIGGELIYNVKQWRETFLDVFGGVRYEQVEIDNKTAAIKGDTGFVIPSVGVRLERNTDLSSTRGSAWLEFGFGGDEDEVQRLGRFNADDTWAVVKFEIEHSFYLEPVLFPSAFRGVGLPRGKGWQPGMTLAHEAYASLRGQWSLDSRLIPTQQIPVGGFYTVRGYDESITAGDNAVILTGEYRLHVPRLFEPKPFPTGFRWRPEEPYGGADWDLIARAFVDIATVSQVSKEGFEFDEDIAGAGLGLELQFKRNLNIRLDWGLALKDAEDPGADAESGDSRIHFSATFLY
jgi:hemolysin activation/secretion protein